MKKFKKIYEEILEEDIIDMGKFTKAFNRGMTDRKSFVAFVPEKEEVQLYTPEIQIILNSDGTWDFIK